jgi:type I restriction enzyme M protein
MAAIERDNPTLKGVLPKDYARPTLDKRRLGELIDLIGTIGLGDERAASKDILGRVYEYFLGSSPAPRASAAGSSTRPLRRQTPGRDARALQGPRLRPLLRLGRHVRPVREVRRGPRRQAGDISIYGQESNPTTWRLAR